MCRLPRRAAFRWEDKSHVGFFFCDFVLTFITLAWLAHCTDWFLLNNGMTESFRSHVATMCCLDSLLAIYSNLWVDIVLCLLGNYTLKYYTLVRGVHIITPRT